MASRPVAVLLDSFAVLLASIAGLALVGSDPTAAGAVEPVDEVHYSLGPDGTSVVVHWRGQPTGLRLGRSQAYDRSLRGAVPAITPVDIAGPFREARVTGLTPGTSYHYRIGTGPDRVLTTSAQIGTPVRWVDTGDTASTWCKPWMAGMHSLIARQTPDFVTHGGDISYANDCGQPAVHRFYNDIATWSQSAALMPSWGNHEYGAPTAQAPAGTPQDSLANYKGRSAIPSAQTLALDTATRRSAPGCPGVAGLNGCRGEDWGYFRAGNVLLISYPEPWPGALEAWRAAATSIMTAAQADPTVHATVTYGHRPPISRAGLASTSVSAAIATLADRFSPAHRPDGKYLLTLSHHVHGEEVFPDFHGVASVVNGGGGTEQVRYWPPIAGSAYQTSHPAIAVLRYQPALRTLKVRLVCGVKIPGIDRDHCTLGSELYRLDLPAPPA